MLTKQCKFISRGKYTENCFKKSELIISKPCVPFSLFVKIYLK